MGESWRELCASSGIGSSKSRHLFQVSPPLFWLPMTLQGSDVSTKYAAMWIPRLKIKSCSNIIRLMRWTLLERTQYVHGYRKRLRQFNLSSKWLLVLFPFIHVCTLYFAFVGLFGLLDSHHHIF